MKKALLVAPAAIYTVAIIVLNIILKTFSPLWYAWALCLWVGGYFLNKGKLWGCILELAPAIHIIYMSTQYTGQAISERPLGVITAMYALVCGFVVWRNNRKTAGAEE